MENAMKSAIATHHFHVEYFVLQIDGCTRSGHRRFIDALRAGLQLKDQFPQREVKVRTVSSSVGAEAASRRLAH
jgi:hypothetical protein